MTTLLTVLRQLKQPVILAFILLLAKLMMFDYLQFNGVMWSSIASNALALLALLGLLELIFPSKWKYAVFVLLNLIISMILFSSSVYYTHFGSVPTYTALQQLDQVMQIRSSVQSTIEPRDYIYFVDLILLALAGFMARRRNNRVAGTSIAWKSAIIVVVLISILLSQRYIRSNSDIPNETVLAQTLGLLNYEAAALIKENKEMSIIQNGNIQETITKINQLKSSYSYQDANKTPQKPAYFGAAKGKNLVIVQMEAFQNFPINLSVAGQELTPVLNGLVKDSLYFPYVYQQIGQGNTSDAEFMSNTSIYPTGTIPMSTGYGDRELPSLPRLLEKQGYEADTFHVNDVTFWDRIKLYPALHFDHYYDKPFYNNDNFNDFGASDEELYRVATDKAAGIAEQGKPFYTQLVTVSSHFPFKVPEDRKRIEVPESMKDTQLGDYLTAVNYTDYAIGTMISRLKQEGLWDNTVLVLYGDHSGLQTNANEPDWIEEQLGIKYDARVSRFNIPLIIHLPGQEKGMIVNQAGGQLDIMPTIANLMGISLKDEKFTAFGNDLLNIDHNVFGIRYYLPTGSFVNDNIMFVPGRGFDDGTAVSLKTLEPVKDIAPYRKDYDYILKLMELSDQYVNLLPKRQP